MDQYICTSGLCAMVIWQRTATVPPGTRCPPTSRSCSRTLRQGKLLSANNLLVKTNSWMCHDGTYLALAAAGEPNLNVSLITACQESCCNQDCELHCTAGEKAKKPWGRAKIQMHSSYGSLKVLGWLSIPREVGPDIGMSHSKCNSTHLHPGVLGQVVEGKGDCVGGGVDPSKKHVQCHDRCCPSVATSFWSFTISKAYEENRDLWKVPEESCPPPPPSCASSTPPSPSRCASRRCQRTPAGYSCCWHQYMELGIE